MSFPEKSSSDKGGVCNTLHSLENGACVFNRRGWSRLGLPEGFSRCSVCVIYPFLKIQTYKCACCKSKGRRGDSSPKQSKLHPLTFPGGFLHFTLCRFQPKHIKVKCMYFCWASVGVISLSLSPEPSASCTKNPG